MTDRQHPLWLALYAAAWFHAPTLRVGTVTDLERAEIAANHADRALTALLELRPEVVDG